MFKKKTESSNHAVSLKINLSEIVYSLISKMDEDDNVLVTDEDVLKPPSILNDQRMPGRIGKKKKLSFGENIVDTPHCAASSAKKPKHTPKQQTKREDEATSGHKNSVDKGRKNYRTHSITNYKVFSNNSAKTVSLRNKSPLEKVLSAYPGEISPIIRNDPLLSESSIKRNRLPKENHVRQYPLKLLHEMVLIRKTLKIKKVKVDQLKAMNDKAQKYNNSDCVFPPSFEYKYATILIDLEKINDVLQFYLNEMQISCHRLVPNPRVEAMLIPSYNRERCREEAKRIVEKQNSKASSVKSPSILDLITDLTALLLQVKNLKDSHQKTKDLQVLQGTMEQIKRKLGPKNQLLFQNSVEIQIESLLVGLGNFEIN